MASMTVCPVSVHANYVSEGSVSLQQEKMEERLIKFAGKKLVEKILGWINSYRVLNAITASVVTNESIAQEIFKAHTWSANWQEACGNPEQQSYAHRILNVLERDMKVRDFVTQLLKQAEIFDRGETKLGPYQRVYCLLQINEDAAFICQLMKKSTIPESKKEEEKGEPVTTPAVTG